MTKTVRPSMSRSIPCSIRDSVRVSMEEVASSRMSTGGSATAARAMARSCRCPWERLPQGVAGDQRVIALGETADEEDRHWR